MDRRQVVAIILIAAILGSSLLVYILLPKEIVDEPVFKGGTISQDVSWSGSIIVNDSIIVPTGMLHTTNIGTTR